MNFLALYITTSINSGKYVMLSLTLVRRIIVRSSSFHFWRQMKKLDVNVNSKSISYVVTIRLDKAVKLCSFIRTMII